MCYISEEKKFSGHKCKGNLLSSVQKLIMMPDLKPNRKNKDHALQSHFHLFSDNFCAYNNQDFSQTSSHISGTRSDCAKIEIAYFLIQRFPNNAKKRRQLKGNGKCTNIPSTLGYSKLTLHFIWQKKKRVYYTDTKWQHWWHSSLLHWMDVLYEQGDWLPDPINTNLHPESTVEQGDSTSSSNIPHITATSNTYPAAHYFYPSSTTSRSNSLSHVSANKRYSGFIEATYCISTLWTRWILMRMGMLRTYISISCNWK